MAFRVEGIVATVKWPGVEGSAASMVLTPANDTGTRCRVQVAPASVEVWNTVQGAVPPTKNAQVALVVPRNDVATAPCAAAITLPVAPVNWLTPSVPPVRWGGVQFTPSVDAATKASPNGVRIGEFGSPFERGPSGVMAPRPPIE